LPLPQNFFLSPAHDEAWRGGVNPSFHARNPPVSAGGDARNRSDDISFRWRRRALDSVSCNSNFSMASHSTAQARTAGDVKRFGDQVYLRVQ
jgi:hypothetical protein